MKLEIVGIPKNKEFEVYENYNDKTLFIIWLEENGRLVVERHATPSFWRDDCGIYTIHRMINDIITGKLNLKEYRHKSQ